MLYHTNPINRDFILQTIGQEAIFIRFLGITPKLGEFYRNPLRDDEIAGCTFYKSRGKLRFIDFSRGWNWDCFDVVQVAYNCGMSEAIKIIAVEFGIVGGTAYSKPQSSTIIERKPLPLQVKRRAAFTSRDMEYWNRFYIDEQTLRTGYVAGLAYTWIGQEVVYKHTEGDEGYVYSFYSNHLKCYFPHRSKTKMRWLQTPGLAVQGWHLLPPTGRLCIVTSSYKDVLFLYRLGFASIAPPSENSRIPEKGIKVLKSRFDNVVLFYNNDTPGIESMENHSKLYDVDYTYIPEGEPKDPTDFYEAEGLSSSIDMLQELFKEYV